MLWSIPIWYRIRHIIQWRNHHQRLEIHTHTSLVNVNPTIWIQQQHPTKLQHQRWGKHTKDNNIPHQKHFWMWQHTPNNKILSYHYGIPRHLHIVQIHRWWILLRVPKPRLNNSISSHKSHNRNINGPYGPTAPRNTIHETDYHHQKRGLHDTCTTN